MSAHKDKGEGTSSGVVVSTGDKRRGAQLRLIGLTAGAIIILVAVVAGVVMVAGHKLGPKKLSPLETSLSATDKALNSGDTAAAQKALQTAKPTTNADKIAVWSRLAGVATNSNDNKTALTYYQQILQLSPNDSSALYNGGDAAAALGDKATAVDLYQRAIKVLEAHKATNHFYDADLQDLQNKLAGVRS